MGGGGGGGGGQVLTILIGGMESFEVVLMHLSFSHTGVQGGGAQKFPLL